MLTAEEWSALWLSFQVGVCAVLASLPAAVALGYALALEKQRRLAPAGHAGAAATGD